MFDFGTFCHLLRLLGIYRMGTLVWVFEQFRPLFSFLSFLFFLFFSFFFSFFFSILHFLFFLSLSLSGAPFSSGAPGHCPPMPPSRYATDHDVPFQTYSSDLTFNITFWHTLRHSACVSSCVCCTRAQDMKICPFSDG